MATNVTKVTTITVTTVTSYDSNGVETNKVTTQSSVPEDNSVASPPTAFVPAARKQNVSHDIYALFFHHTASKYCQLNSYSIPFLVTWNVQPKAIVFKEMWARRKRKKTSAYFRACSFGIYGHYRPFQTPTVGVDVFWVSHLQEECMKEATYEARLQQCPAFGLLYACGGDMSVCVARLSDVFFEGWFVAVHFYKHEKEHPDVPYPGDLREKVKDWLGYVRREATRLVEAMKARLLHQFFSNELLQPPNTETTNLDWAVIGLPFEHDGKDDSVKPNWLLSEIAPVQRKDLQDTFIAFGLYYQIHREQLQSLQDHCMDGSDNWSVSDVLSLLSAHDGDYQEGVTCFYQDVQSILRRGNVLGWQE